MMTTNPNLDVVPGITMAAAAMSRAAVAAWAPRAPLDDRRSPAPTPRSLRGADAGPARRAHSPVPSPRLPRASRRSRLPATNPRRDDPYRAPRWDDDIPDDDPTPRRPRDDRYDDRYDRRAPPGAPPPDVTLLTQREVQSLIPVGATGEQYAYFWGGAETAIQRLGFSLVGLVTTVNASALLAVPAATFFLWAPVALAARRNVAARRGRNVGLWRARVLAVETREADPTPGFYDRTVDARGGPPGRGGWMLSLLVGDASGARVELRTPLARRHADIREGEEVELVVGSDDNYFARFEAVREAYFPRTGMWVGEYPFLDRRAMPRVSERIARDARDRDEWYARRGGGGDDSFGGGYADSGYVPYD